jgi:hypothetical protein
VRIDQIREVLERLRAAGKEKALLAGVWAFLDDLEVSFVYGQRELNSLRARVGEDGIRAVLPTFIVFHRRTDMDSPGGGS